MPRPMDARQLVAWNLRRLRVTRGVSQDDLALSAGLERAHVGYIESGKRNPTVVTLEKIAHSLGVHISELFRQQPEGAEPLAPLKAGRRKSHS